MMRQTPARPARTQMARKEMISVLVLLTGGPFVVFVAVACLPRKKQIFHITAIFL